MKGLHAAANMAAKKFQGWQQDRPSLRRQHLLSRTTAGWIASPTGLAPETTVGDEDDLDGISWEELQQALAPTAADTPLAAQQLANFESESP